jgi:hypothetical protein
MRAIQHHHAAAVRKLLFHRAAGLVVALDGVPYILSFPSIGSTLTGPLGAGAGEDSGRCC